MAGRNLEDHLFGKEEGPTAILSRQSAWPHSIVLIATEVFRHLGYGRQASVSEAGARLDGLLPIPAGATVVTDEDVTRGTAQRKGLTASSSAVPHGATKDSGKHARLPIAAFLQHIYPASSTQPTWQ